MNKIAIICQTDKLASFYLNIANFMNYYKEYFIIDLFFEDKKETINLKEYSLLYCFKTDSTAIINIIYSAKQLHIPVIYETDDNFLAYVEGQNNQFVKSMIQIDNIKNILTISDIVLCYSIESLKSFLIYNTNVAILPTYQTLGLNIEHNGMSRERNDKKIIGFMGTKFKDLNFTFVIPALHAIHNLYSNIYFEFIGFIPKIAHDLPNLIYTDVYMPYDNFITLFHSKGWMVGLAPLADVEYNRSKTNNKYREYAAACYSCICSNVEPYKSSVKADENALLSDNNVDDWVYSIEKLINSRELRDKLCINAFNDIKNNYKIERVAKIKLYILKEIIKNHSIFQIKILTHKINLLNNQFLLN